MNKCIGTDREQQIVVLISGIYIVTICSYGDVVAIQRLGGDPWNRSSVSFSTRHLPHCCPHALDVRLAVDRLEPILALTFHFFSNALCQCPSFLDSTRTHQPVLAPQLGFYLWSKILRVT
jgi:hypothetical protein